MLSSVLLVVPVRGSELISRIGTCNSDEYQRSCTVWITCEFPAVPAGMVRVSRVPAADTPEMNCGPSVSVRRFGSAGCEFVRAPLPRPLPGFRCALPGATRTGMSRETRLTVSRVWTTPATGSSMVILLLPGGALPGGVLPCAPGDISLTSFRTRPWPSRKILICCW
jgi:hypothetical protein